METITFEGQTIEIDAIGLPVTTETGIRCGSCKTRHLVTKAVKLCYEMQAEFRAQQEEEIRAEAAVERYFEDRGYWDNAAHDEWERSRGVVGFTEAWHRESPETCPCCNG